MVLAVAGTTLVCGVVLVEVAAASGAEVAEVLASGAPGLFSLLAVLAFFVGLILFGAATMRADVFPRQAGLALIVGDVVFGVGGFLGAASSVGYLIGAAITGAALVWLGFSLLSGSGASAERPARVS